MSRFATLAAAGSIVAGSMLAGSASAGGPAALPSGLSDLRMRPAMSDGVELASLGKSPTTPADAPRPTLAARMAMAPKLLARVDISDQTMTVTVEGAIAYTWKVSTAGKGYRTPTGVWKPTRMHTMWHSRKYDNAPMPHSIFFTGGYAIHATPHVKRLGRPASHGCVRLHPDDARRLFALARHYGPAAMRIVIQQ